MKLPPKTIAESSPADLLRAAADKMDAAKNEAASSGTPEAESKASALHSLGAIYRDWVAKNDHRISAYSSGSRADDRRPEKRHSGYEVGRF